MYTYTLMHSVASDFAAARFLVHQNLVEEDGNPYEFEFYDI